MEDKIKVLFHNRDAAGVNYFRTQTPAMELERYHSDEFRVEINSEIDFNKPETIEYLKSFHIIHYHRQLIGGIPNALKLANELKAAGVTLIMDIDDYWYLDKSHPYYPISKEKKLYEEIIDNLKIADYITTTTDFFAKAIRKHTGKDNVIVLYNSIDPDWMKQFKNNWTPDPDGLVRITYMAGSSHKGDVQQLIGAIGKLNNDKQTKGKFKITVAGWDTAGTTTDVKFNQEFSNVLKRMGLWNRDMVKLVNKYRGDVDQLPIPQEIKETFRGKVFNTKQRDIHSKESIYLEYEKILTDNYSIINDNDYIEWLSKYERDTYTPEGSYARRWTEKANMYASVLDETDIAIAPLLDHTFNNMKSNLKQVECWSRKLPVVCTDVIPYNVHGRHLENCVLIPTKNNKGGRRKNLEKYWYKYLKKLILEPELRKKIGENLYKEFGETYHLKNVTNKRAEFYNTAVMESLKVV
jgi:glycosyltransferase involved in cell wall biosynthesis